MGIHETKSAAATELDYDKQPLPLIGVYSCYSSVPDCSVYDSDFNLVSRMTQPVTTNASAASGELFATLSTRVNTDSNVGSSSDDVAGWVKSTTCFSADGHKLLRLSPNGGLAGKQLSTSASLLASFGVVIGEEGYRQPMSLYFNGTTVQQYTRGGTAVLDTLTTSLNSASAATWAGTNSNMRSAVGYHRAAGMLVAIEARDASCSYRAHIWTHPAKKLNGRSGDLNAFVLEAKAGTNGGSYRYIDFTWNVNSASSIGESQYRMRVIPTTSGKIALVRFVPNYVTHMAVLTPTTGNAGTLDTSFSSNTVAASYGFETGNSYGMRHNVTWDNKWCACYGPYYRYGSGISGHVVNTDDPTSYYRLSYTSSTDGVALIPQGKSGFVYSQSQTNADTGNGLAVGLMDFSTPLMQPSGVVTNGAVISMSVSGGMIDTGYTSANYPTLMPVENWHI